MRTSLTRRSVLRGSLHGSAVAIALPFLDCFLNGNGTALAANGAPLPVRFGTWFWGLGLTPGRWLPGVTGPDYDLKEELRFIAPYKRKVTVLSGFDVKLDGHANHPHFSGNMGIRTGIAPREDNIHEGPSIDVMIADAIGGGTRFRSLELTSCASAVGNNQLSIPNSYSFRAPGVTNPSEPSPVALYARLFGSEFAQPSKEAFAVSPEIMARNSVLSAVKESRDDLLKSVGAVDRARLDQYFTSLRQIEQQLQLQMTEPPPVEACKVPQAATRPNSDNEIASVMATHKVMAQLLAMALACHQTNVFNVVFSSSVSELRNAGDSTGHHQLTHQELVDEKLGYQPKSTFFVDKSMEAWGEFLSALDGIREGDGTLLDHCLVLAHTDCWLARSHTIQGIPMMLAGSAGGRVRTGLHIAGNSDPVTRVGLTLQQLMGINIDRWGSRSLETAKPIGELFI